MNNPNNPIVKMRLEREAAEKAAAQQSQQAQAPVLANGDFNNSAFTAKPQIAVRKAAAKKKAFFSSDEEEDFAAPAKQTPAYTQDTYTKNQYN